ncbi:MAG: hypothetical protein E7466_01810 [Ruminococcaceae bacterium]|nr:hypothetical protein [Oscillospiraceae bacterium]
MDNRLERLYHLPDIAQLEDVHLETLREHCAVLEERMSEIIGKLSLDEQQIIEAYLDIRNELKYQSVKTALKWGKIIMNHTSKPTYQNAKLSFS